MRRRVRKKIILPASLINSTIFLIVKERDDDEKKNQSLPAVILTFLYMIIVSLAGGQGSQKSSSAADHQKIDIPGLDKIPSQTFSVRGESEEKESVGELVQLVVFRLGKEEFCVDIGEVREIVKKPEISLYVKIRVCS